MWRVLCVDDDQQKARDVGEYLAAWNEGNEWGAFTFEVETSFEGAVHRITYEHFDLVTLDLHGASDPRPEIDDRAGEQEGRRILEDLKGKRFLPVVFYTGYADKIKSLVSGVVKVVKKGEDDVVRIRAAVSEIFETGLPQLSQRIEEDKRLYMWDVVDKEWEKIQADGTYSDLAYLLARRLAARFGRTSVKELLKHEKDTARPIELYIYPPLTEAIRTGCILGPDDAGIYWIVATPACDFARKDKLDNVLLIGAHELKVDPYYRAWVEGKTANKREALEKLVRNNKGDRYRFFPGTFFLPDLVVDIQCLKQMPIDEFMKESIICRLDSPYREEFVLHVSRYYGRIGTPDLDHAEILAKLA